MRMNLTRLLCWFFIALSPSLLVQSCSSTPDDADLEEQFDEEGNFESANEEGGNEEGAEEFDNEQELAEDSYGDEELNYDAELNEGQAAIDGEQLDSQLEGEQTTTDLEDIIAGQNANQEIAPIENIPAMPEEGIADAGMDAGVMEQQPMTASIGAALPEQGSKMPYIVRVGDSLSSVAQKIYGDMSKWSEMAELSAISNPNIVKPGDVVYYQLNDQTLAFATAYEGTAKVAVTVQPGDTLSGIAQRVYGSHGDWKYVWRQNAEVENPDRLEVGQTLYYLSAEGLAAAIDFARSITVADLVKKTFKKETVKKEIVKTQKTSTPDVQQNVQQPEMTGFQMAASMFNVMVTNFGFVG